MNRKVLGIWIAAIVLAAVVPVVVLPAFPGVTAASVTPRFLWNTTDISFLGNTYNTELFKGHVINITVGNNVTTLNPDGTGNVLMVKAVNGNLTNMDVSFTVIGDPTYIKNVTAAVAIFPGQLVPYTTTWKYQSYTNYVGKGTLTITFQEPINPMNINNMTINLKVYFANGQILTRTIIVIFDHELPGIQPLSISYNATNFEFNTTSKTYYNSTTVTKSLVNNDIIPYFDNSSGINLTVNFKDDLAVYKMGVEIIDLTTNESVAKTEMYINNTKYLLKINANFTPVSTLVGKGVPPSLYPGVVNFSYVVQDVPVAGILITAPNTLLLYDAKYIMNRTAISPEDVFTMVNSLLPDKVIPISVSGKAQDINVMFHITGTDLQPNHLYKIVICAKDPVGNKVTKTIYIGDPDKPTIVIGAPSPGSIYNSQGYTGIKAYFYIFDNGYQGKTSNITYVSIALKDQFGNTVPLDEYIGTFKGPSDFNWTIGTDITGYALNKLISPREVPTNKYTNPFYFTLEYLTHNMPDGKYYLIVTAKDRAGNVVTTETYFIIDTVAPRILSVKINGEQYNTTTSGTDIHTDVVGGYIDLSWNATDKIQGYPDVTTSGIAAYYVSVSNEEGQTIGTYTLSTPYIHLNLPAGNYKVELYAKDAANNPVDPSYIVTINLNVQPGSGLASFVEYAKTLSGTFVISSKATADNYAALMFAAPTTGPLPVRSADDFNYSTLTNNSYIILIGGPAVNPVAKHYQQISPVKMEANGSTVVIMTPKGNFTWTAPKPWYNVSRGYFVIQLITDPNTGAKIFMIYGTDRDSTAAGAYWLYKQFETGNIYKYSKETWIVGMWKDTDHKVSFDFLKGTPDDKNGFSFDDAVEIVAEG